MDGVQELVGVTVLAATNRPDAIVIAFLGHFYSVFKSYSTFRILH